MVHGLKLKITARDQKIRGFKNLENGLKNIGFASEEINNILGNNWFNFYKGIH